MVRGNGGGVPFLDALWVHCLDADLGDMVNGCKPNGFQLHGKLCFVLENLALPSLQINRLHSN